MPAFSTSIFRYQIPLSSRFHLPSFISAEKSSSGRGNSPAVRRPPPDKKILKAKDSVRESSTFSRVLESSESDSWRNLLPDHAIGRVIAAQANFLRVSVDSAGGDVSRVGIELLCVVKAVMKKIGRRVLVGDRVLVGSVDWVDRRGMIEDIFGRRTQLSDPPIANVDHLLLLFSMNEPKIESFNLTRFLVEAESTGIPLTLALNKMELVGEEMLTSWETKLDSWGYKPVFCSVDCKLGLEKLESILQGQTTVIVGPSGVGKSSLINALRRASYAHGNEDMDNLLDERVGTVSKRSGRGKHTTRHVSLLPLNEQGFLADTPGFNQPTLLKVTKKSLAETFPEIRQMLSDSQPSGCAFNDCLHVGEPGCVVKGDWERFPFYLQLLDEIKVREEIQLRTLGTKRESDVRYKVIEMGVKQAEPRLQPKKHRRVSRKSMNQSFLNELMEEDFDLGEIEGNGNI